MELSRGTDFDWPKLIAWVTFVVAGTAFWGLFGWVAVMLTRG
jgi:hypothetical protein